MSLTQRIQRAQREQQLEDEVQGPQPPAPINALVPTVPAGETVVAREEFLREVRRGLQTEVVTNSHALFDATDTPDLRPQVDGIVDRYLAGNSLAVTRAERVRLVDEVLA